MTTTTASDRTIRIYADNQDPADPGLAWKSLDGEQSGAYDAAIDLDELDEVLARQGVVSAIWDHDNGGSVTVTGPADHPILAAAR